MNNPNPRIEELNDRLVRIEDKLDTHLQRVTQAEKDIEWLRGHVKMATTIFLAVLGAIGTYLINFFFPTRGN